MVGLSNVDDTSDAGKPVSTPTRTALHAKRNTITSIESVGACTALGYNQRRVATTDAKLKFQRVDDDGSIITDAWEDEMSLNWNTNANKQL